MTGQLKQARLLVPAARQLAAAAWEPLRARYPEINTMFPALPGDRWQFFFVVASVGISFLLAPVQVASELQEEVCQIVAAALEGWHPQAHDALKDFLDFVHQRQAQEVELPAAVGVWFLWNLKQAKPTPTELALAWPLGLFFLHSFKDWWVLGQPVEQGQDHA